MNNFTFIDLFAGIGGFHLAMHNLGGKCVFSSEIDAHARKTYEHNHKKISPELFESGNFNSDIRNINPLDIPDFDVLCAGFPCQPFSQAGFKRGFSDNHDSERGNLFFNIAEIIEAKKPKAFFLENVRGLLNHDNGNTLKTIQNILTEELGYSFHFQIIKASDFGLPQLRPRLFMVGFRDNTIPFKFPDPIPLKMTMSDVWGGKCSRDVGFTLRVGGRGSNIDDRRNWDAYLVDGVVRKIMPEQAKKMQGFPDDFTFPVPNTQAMKQLGNSVAVNAIQATAQSLINSLFSNTHEIENMKTTKNKGEWTELLSFIKLLHDRKIHLSDPQLMPKNDFFNVSKVTTKNIDKDCYLKPHDEIEVVSKKDGSKIVVQAKDILNESLIQSMVDAIKSGSKTFNVPEFDVLENSLGFSIIKGGTSSQKSDIVLDISNHEFSKENEGFGVKSYLGSKPTLLNASGNTNFIYNIIGINSDNIDEINNINTKTKIKDRIAKIEELGGNLVFQSTEKEALEYNLKLIDSHMPEIVSAMLLEFYVNRTSKIKDVINNIHENGSLQKKIQYGDIDALIIKAKRLLVDVLLGFFAGTKWDGNYVSNGTIVVKNTGDQVAFHIVDRQSLENYLFDNIRFDTPSSTRHRFGSAIKEKNNLMNFKLNIQLRF